MTGLCDENLHSYAVTIMRIKEISSDLYGSGSILHKSLPEENYCAAFAAHQIATFVESTIMLHLQWS